MATRTQVGFEIAQGCVHEQICQAIYEQQRRRILALCQWMAPEAASARQLALTVFTEAWRAPDASWPAVGGERLLESFAARFRSLFHAGADPSPAQAWNGDGAGPRLVKPGSAAAGAGGASPGGVRAAVAALPLPQRLLYLLHELEGCSAFTLAHWLDLEPAVCAAMIHEARLHLRQALRSA
ncbi:MAG: hypothetical protein ACRD1L_00645 [Terriglobales bacterium]